MANVKRTDSDKASRRMAEATVDLFLDVILSGEDRHAWAGMGLLGKLVDFKGQIPKSSGHCGFDTLGPRAEKYRSWSPAHQMAVIVMREISDRQREAVCYDRAVRGKVRRAVDPFWPKNPIDTLFDDERCAEDLRCSVDSFQRRVLDGYNSLEQLLNRARAA